MVKLLNKDQKNEVEELLNRCRGKLRKYDVI